MRPQSKVTSFLHEHSPIDFGSSHKDAGKT